MVVMTCVSGVSGVLQCLDSREAIGSSFGVCLFLVIIT